MRLLPLVLLIGCASFATVRAENREHLNRLSPGMSKAEVLSVMGTDTRRIRGGERITNPYRTEFYHGGGSEWEILLYYTDEKRDDNAITDDELTPLVLRDGRLDGWGWSYWQGAIKKYEIRIR